MGVGKMAIYRNVHLTFWSDAKVTDEFTPEDKYFYLYLLTNPHTNLSGCYEISLKQISREMGYTQESIEGLIKRFSEVHRIIIYDKGSKEMLLINWSKYNWTKSTKFITALEKEIESVKNEGFKKFLRNRLYGIDTVSENEIYPIYTVSSGVEYPMDTTDTGTVTDSVSDSITDADNKDKEREKIKKVNNAEADRPKRKKFVPPTVEEVEEYCFERNNKVDAEMFVDFYSSKGWMIGKNPMKDWKAAVRTWERKDKENGKTSQNRNSGGIDWDNV